MAGLAWVISAESPAHVHKVKSQPVTGPWKLQPRKQRITIKPFRFWGTHGAGFLKASEQRAVLSHVCVGRPSVSVKGPVSTSRLT